ncbi:MAG TPA: hypothetical protein VE569_03810, partial [Acidimicrobiia bacterium]|nr:hypothetical protein [Acidimicrobiia bacterium]
MAEEVAAPGPITTVDPRVEARLAAIGRLFRWLAAVFSVVAMLATVFPVLANIPPGPALVRDTPVSTAVSLAVLAFGSLIAGGPTRTGTAKTGWRRVGVVMALLAAVF